MLRILNVVLVSLLSVSILAGCSVHQVTGDTMTSYTRQHLIPYLMEQGTLENACGLGLSMGGFLNSFERVTDSPHHAAIPTLVSAASCFEEQAWLAELRYMRAVGRAQVSEATDARIEQKNAHGKAAETLYTAYLRTNQLFAHHETSCPELETDEDQLVWLLGQMAGIQAVQHDGSSGRLVGVPQNIPVKVMRAMSCIDNEKWWGLPESIQAAVWIIVPGSQKTMEQKSSVDPYASLEKNLSLAESTVVRAAFAIAVMVYENVGNSEAMRKTIARYSKLTDSAKGKWRLLELVAKRQLLAASDKVWTSQTGHRTPIGAFGSFPEENNSSPGSTDGDLLDDL